MWITLVCFTFCFPQEGNEAREESENQRYTDMMEKINQEEQNLNKSKQEIELKIKVWIPHIWYIFQKQKCIEPGAAEIWGTRSH